jgi:hypothetical protein
MYNLGQSELQSVIPEVLSHPDLYTIYVINLRYSKIGEQIEAKVARRQCMKRYTREAFMLHSTVCTFTTLLYVDLYLGTLG